MILELDNVELYFRSKPILQGIYLKASSGEITHILGNNGSGKSALLRIIFGDLQPKYHLLRLDGQAQLRPLYTTGKVKWLPEFTFIPSQFSLKRAFDSYEVSWQEFKNCFPEFRPEARSGLKSLSTGERRLIEVYLSLQGKAEILLLDEPFRSLSPINIEKVRALILEQKKDKLIIGADHSMAHWEDLPDRRYRLENKSLKPLT
jgi:ABC-type multidrug transport system ATPase subunit